MKHFDLYHKCLLRSGGLCSEMTIRDKNIKFNPISFIRTGDTSIEVLFSMTITLLIPDVADSSNRKNVSEQIYKEVEEHFSKRDMSEFEGFVSFGRCRTDPDSMVQHFMDNSKSIDCEIPHKVNKRYTILTVESFVVFEINFDKSSRINKMIITGNDKYLGRYLSSNEERTDVLLQDKEA